MTGVGFGVAWLGVLRSLVSLASPTGRAALLAAIFVVAYVAFALPAVVAGFLVTLVGLHDAALWYGGAVGLLALAGLVPSNKEGARKITEGAVRLNGERITDPDRELAPGELGDGLLQVGRRSWARVLRPSG